MYTKEEIFAAIDLPSAVTVTKEENTITVKGKLGTLKKDLTRLPATVSIEDKKLIIKPYGTRKKDLAITNTARSIIESMIKGVENGFTYKLKIVYAHFPISVKARGKEIYIENYFGERSPRVSKVVGDDTKVNIFGEDVVVQGPSLEHVSQTASQYRIFHKSKRQGSASIPRWSIYLLKRRRHELEISFCQIHLCVYMRTDIGSIFLNSTRNMKRFPILRSLLWEIFLYIIVLFLLL